MCVLDEAKRVARNFEYLTEDVNRGVKAFISQMGLYFGLGSLGKGC